MYKAVTIGADIEMFLQHRTTGEVVSAEGIIQGTKEKPFCFDARSQHFNTSLDNVLAEIGIPPATSKAEFYNNIRHSRSYVESILPEHLQVLITPSANLDESQLQTRNAQRFGCESDWNAYTAEMNEPPRCLDRTLRSAGGHIHIGYAGADAYKIYNFVPDAKRIALVKALDLFVGVPSVLMEPENKRKELYGKAGAFRPKEYGLEYRTISNFYLQKRRLTLWVYDAAKAAIDWLNAGNAVLGSLESCVKDCIDNNRKDEAARLIETFQLKVA